MNQTVTLKVKRLRPDAILPKLATAGSACFDLFAVSDSFGVHPKDKCAAIFETGLAFEVPPGWAMEIYSRSGQGFNDAIRLSNCVGIIDSDYRGEVKVALRYDGEGQVPRPVNRGDRIAQAKLVQVPTVVFEEVEDLSDTARGQGGFGSTGS